eukprot:1643918-Prymnesium_polylepis.1
MDFGAGARRRLLAGARVRSQPVVRVTLGWTGARTHGSIQVAGKDGAAHRLGRLDKLGAGCVCRSRR